MSKRPVLQAIQETGGQSSTIEKVNRWLRQNGNHDPVSERTFAQIMGRHRSRLAPADSPTAGRPAPVAAEPGPAVPAAAAPVQPPLDPSFITLFSAAHAFVQTAGGIPRARQLLDQYEQIMGVVK